MNVPNLLSILRLVITAFFIVEVHHSRFTIAIYLFILQGITDLLDGFIARVWSKKTSLGAFLDPLADKTMLVAALVMLSIKGFIPVWLTILIIAKDLVVAGGFLILYRLAYTTQPVPSIFGKVTTTCQIVTILYALWSGTGELGPFFFYATAFFTTLSGLHYIYVGVRMLRSEKNKASV